MPAHIPTYELVGSRQATCSYAPNSCMDDRTHLERQRP